MNTDELIGKLSAEAGKARAPMGAVWGATLAAAAVVAAAVFFATIGPRPDIAAAAETTQFLMKFVVTIALAVSAFYVLDRLARPGAVTPATWLALLTAPVLLAAAMGVELLVQPSEQWQMLVQGKNSLTCLTYIPAIGIGPLALLIVALRRGAPTRPGLAGVVAGILAGGIAATFYAAHCTDDSPLFVATWYTIAIAMLAVAGGVLGRFTARW
jgi:hypothetical protein